MVTDPRKKALEMLWEDRCSIYHKEKVTDPVTKLTDFEEKPLFLDQPCKLSFESLASTEGDPVATVTQTVKLFISANLKIPPGCRIDVTRPKQPGRIFSYTNSGLAGVFTYHQEILLDPWEGWA